VNKRYPDGVMYHSIFNKKNGWMPNIDNHPSAHTHTYTLDMIDMIYGGFVVLYKYI